MLLLEFKVVLGEDYKKTYLERELNGADQTV